MSAAVTEPNNFSSSPTRAEHVSDTCCRRSAPAFGAAAGVLGRLEAGALSGDALAITGRGLVGESARNEVVARVTVRHFDDVTRLAHVFDGVAKNDFHVVLRSGERVT